MTKKKQGGAGDRTTRRNAGGHKLTPEARRALEEATARRADIDKRSKARLKEIDGGDRPEPIRYGDWEVKGRVSDF